MSGKEYVKPGSELQIKNLAMIMDAYPNVEFRLKGYVDAGMNEQEGTTLSNRRAKYIMSLIVGEGIAFTRMKATGGDHTKPVADEQTEEGRARNRRVEICVSKK